MSPRQPRTPPFPQPSSRRLRRDPRSRHRAIRPKSLRREMSKRLSSSAMCKRLATVGKILEDSNRATTRQQIDAWLDTNSECHDKLLKLMEACMIHEMVTGKQEANLPRSCTKLNLVADHVLSRSLGKSNPSLTIATLRDLKKKDPKVKDKLRIFALALDPNYGMKGHLATSDWYLSWSHRAEILGNRLAAIRVENAQIDWQRYGCYSWAMPVAGQQDGRQWTLLGQSEIQNATHIVHVASKIGIGLERLEIPKVDSRWVIQNNWNEKETTLSNGGRFFVQLWPDFQGQDFFDYTARLTAKYPDSPFLTHFGKEAQEVTKADRKAAQDAAHAAVEASKKAGFARHREPMSRGTSGCKQALC